MVVYITETVGALKSRTRVVDLEYALTALGNGTARWVVIFLPDKSGSISLTPDLIHHQPPHEITRWRSCAHPTKLPGGSGRSDGVATCSSGEA